MSDPLSNSERTMRTAGSLNNDGALNGNLGPNLRESVGIITASKPKALDVCEVKYRPCFQTYDDWFMMDKKRFEPGLYFHNQSKNDQEPIDTWICSPIHAEARTCNEHLGNWGLLLKFIDPSKHWHEYAMPMRLLRGNGEELRGMLLDMGVSINPDAHRLLMQWLAKAKPKNHITAVTRTGWHQHKEELIFVLPEQVIGSNQVCFQSEHSCHHDFKSAGTLEGWQNHIASLCVGNPLLQLVVSAAFAGPLLKKIKQHDGSLGIHLVGDSSKGKTTALHVAASVWGPPTFVKSWRATGNGLESVATTQNDTLLVLDEISESAPYEIGNIVYALGNGVGKQRANRHGTSKETNRWRVIWLSSGERTLSAHMREANLQTKTGQQVRLLDVPATNKLYGAFDVLHGHENGGTFAETLNQAYHQHYGHAGIQFVECLIEDKRALVDLYTKTIDSALFVAKDSLMGRAAKAFALIGLAGELAINYHIVNWERGSAIKAASIAYEAWQTQHNGSYTEDEQILYAVRDFIERYGDSKFAPLKSDLRSTAPAHDRAGFWKDSVDGRIYCFFPAALERTVLGFDKNRITYTLEQAGWLIDKDKGRRTKKFVLSDGTKISLYAIKPYDSEEIKGALNI